MSDKQHLKMILFKEQEKLEDLEVFYHYQEIFAREIMNHAQDKLVEIEQEKKRIMKNTNDLELVKKSVRSSCKQPFSFADNESC